MPDTERRNTSKGPNFTGSSVGWGNSEVVGGKVIIILNK